MTTLIHNNTRFDVEYEGKTITRTNDPVNLDKVEYITREDDNGYFLIGFYFKERAASWAFRTEEEREDVINSITFNYSRGLA